MVRTWHKILIALAGVLFVLGGVIILCNPAETLRTVAFFVGFLTLFSGMATLIIYGGAMHYFWGSGWVLLEGIVTILLSILLICNNWLVTASLPFVFGMWMLFSGVQKIVTAVDLKYYNFRYWWLVLVLGVACTLLGIASFLAPAVGAVSITVLIGAAFAAYGLALFVMLYGINKLEKIKDNLFF